MTLRTLVIITTLALCTACGVFSPIPARAIDYSENSAPQEELLEAKVLEILEEKEIETAEGKRLYQKLELEVLKGPLKGTRVTIENGVLPLANQQQYKIGNKVIITHGQDYEGNDYYYITDYLRRAPLAWLFVIFVVLVAFIAKWQGVTSLLGMGISFLVIFKFILPKILAGADPVLIAILGSLLIVPLTFYLSHGLNRKTTVAMTGTVITLVATGILAKISVGMTKLTGFASEEAGFLQVYQQGNVDIKGLLLAGIIIGTLGILDDITVSQSAIVSQLKETNPRLRRGELFKRAMNIGQDHISSMVNTLVLVYTGASLPLLLLFLNSEYSFSEIINHELVADEIVRTLVGSIGLILAVPITTFIASLTNEKKPNLLDKRAG